MNEQEIRDEFQRNDENDPRGRNVGAIDNLLQMLNFHRESTEPSIRSIAENFGALSKLKPNFVIFESSNPTECFYMHTFSALQIGAQTDPYISSHEFGHAVAGIATGTQVPDDYENVILRAQQYALSPEHKEFFKSYMMYIAKTGQDARTEGEKGPLSDIISAVFQREGHRIGSVDNVCMLPSYHNRGYYFDEEKNCMKIDKIYDENFANYYALRANNCEKEIATLREMFGDEFIEVLESQLQKATSIIERANGKEEHTNEVMDSIKGAITGVNRSELQDIKSPEREVAREDKEGEVK